MLSGVYYLFLFTSFGLVFYCTDAAFQLEKIKLVFYYGPDYKDSVSYNLSEATEVLSHPKFIYEETHCYIHGFGENQSSESIHVIVDAYLKRNNINLLTIDWADAVNMDYFSAALENVETLGPIVADMFLDLYGAGLNRKSLNVVSHSLGSQLAGIAGRSIIKKTNGKVKFSRLVVLDPAFPLFYNLFALLSVNSNDAEFLQSIHTDIGTYGQPTSLGHVDFWPNGGRQGQPGCPQGILIPFSKEDLCSHQRSWRFWAESVANVDGPEFWAVPSPSYELLLKDGIEMWKDQAIQMGINCPMDARGNYFLRTNSAPPFAKGFSGY